MKNVPAYFRRREERQPSGFRHVLPDGTYQHEIYQTNPSAKMKSPMVSMRILKSRAKMTLKTNPNQASIKPQ
jgi:hypothetical protein